MEGNDGSTTEWGDFINDLCTPPQNLDDSELELEAYTHVYPADMDRKQPVTVNLPDSRHYTCRVYQNGEISDTFGVGE